MRYVSSRDPAGNSAVSLSEAISRGVAPDGGLFMPEAIPKLSADRCDTNSLSALAEIGLSGFFQGDDLGIKLGEISHDALNFDIPIRRVQEGLHVLELFHGPTAAFKDVGARFLAACMANLVSTGAKKTVLVATSGDTGGAVASAFYKREGFEVVILYPRGRVSPLQAHQLGCWGANVRTFAVDGSFDDCQRLVKEAFANRDLCATLGLTSANSINIGRLLPQIVYYLHAANVFDQHASEPPGVVVPSGNLGNVTACVLAKHMGARIGPVVMACNANRTVFDFFETGEWRPRASVNTLASAMDVGDPSNMERLRVIFSDLGELRKNLQVTSVSDEQISASIRSAFKRWGQAWCPHTASGLHAYEQLPRSEKTRRPWLLAATAHAAKFAEVVEPLIGEQLEMPASLSELMGRSASAEPLAADSEAFRLAILS